MEIFALIVLAVLSMAGFAAIFFTTFGTFLILIGALLYSLMTEFVVLPPRLLLVLIFLYLCGEVLEYVCVVLGAKKFGASNKAAAGALIGGIFGAAAGVYFFGIGIIFGTFLGIFFGAFTVEYLIQKDLVRSLKAGAGGVFGRIGSIAAKVIIAAIMFAVMLPRVIRFSF